MVAQLPERFGLELHAFVLMDNHYHLLVRTPQANLSYAIRWLNVSYGCRFNASKKTPRLPRSATSTQMRFEGRGGACLRRALRGLGRWLHGRFHFGRRLSRRWACGSS